MFKFLSLFSFFFMITVNLCLAADLSIEGLTGKEKNRIVNMSLLNLSKMSHLRDVEIPENDSLGERIINYKDWFSYFLERVEHIKRFDTGDQNLYASVNPELKTLYIHDGFYTLSPHERLATLMHEARHFDMNNFPHVACVGQDGLAHPQARPSCDPHGVNDGPYMVSAQVLMDLSYLLKERFPKASIKLNEKALKIHSRRLNKYKIREHEEHRRSDLDALLN